MKLLAAALLLAAPPEEAEPFCDAITKIAEAAEGEGGFAALAGTSLDTLLQSYCVVPPSAKTFLCHRNLSPPGISGDAIAVGIGQCLPEARITREDRGFKAETLVEHGRLRVGLLERGTERSHVGRSITLYFSTTAGKPELQPSS